jgi:hypothetical protein
MSKVSGVYSTTFGEKASPLPFYLHETDRGEVIGHCGPVTFHGSRRDDEMNLMFEVMPLKEFEKALAPTTKPVYDTLNLRLIEGKWSFDGSSGLASQIQLILDKTGGLPTNQSIQQLKNQSLDVTSSVVCSVIKTIVNYLLDLLEIEIGDTLKPMSICGFDQQGRGAWILGRKAPGHNFPPMFLHTFWMPYCWSDPACTPVGTNFSFQASLDDYILFSDVINALQTTDNFLKHIGINIDSFITDLEDLHNKLDKGKFAFFFVFSTHTRYFSLVFLNEMGLTVESVRDYPVIRTLAQALYEFLPGVGTFDLKAGSSWTDNFTGRSGSFLSPTCNPPYWFCYLLGSANVTFT